jgi:3-polyprenyl-4-hydroxybenzoate decarboxylase
MNARFASAMASGSADADGLGVAPNGAEVTAGVDQEITETVRSRANGRALRAAGAAVNMPRTMPRRPVCLILIALYLQAPSDRS